MSESGLARGGRVAGTDGAWRRVEACEARVREAEISDGAWGRV